MATLLPDIIEGAEINDTIDGLSIVRVFHVKDLAVSATADPQLLAKALNSAGVPQLRDSHPSNASCTVTQRLVRGTANDQARVFVRYETPTFGNSPLSTFYVSDSTTLMAERVQLGPQASPLIVEFGSGASALTAQANIDRLTPMRTLNIVGSVMYNVNLVQIQNARKSVGRVNDRVWAALPKGYWLNTQFQTDTLDKGTTYQVTAQFITRQYRDWKAYSWYYNAWGRLEPRTVSLGHQTDIKAMMAAEYEFAPPKQSGLGFMTVGLYDLADFGAIFGNFADLT
jgi:hypothetical protein